MRLLNPERAMTCIALLVACLPLRSEPLDESVLLNDPDAIRVLLSAKLETTLSSQHPAGTAGLAGTACGG